MCGIAGFFSFDQKPLLKSNIQNMVLALKHRGPDDQNFWQNEDVQLGHSRLRVIDLSKEAGQPMCNEDQSLWLVFNGEIYNFQELRSFLIAKGHIFRSKGDSEVVLHLYEEMGSDCVKKIDGMFAFALWDQKRKEFFLAKDRSGKKPLYYYIDDHTFAFASEIKSFFNVSDVSIEIDEKEHKATIEVANDQLSLAIGKGGQNVRLAAKLTGWKINIAETKEAAKPKGPEATQPPKTLAESVVKSPAQAQTIKPAEKKTTPPDAEEQRSPWDQIREDMKALGGILNPLNW